MEYRHPDFHLLGEGRASEVVQESFRVVVFVVRTPYARLRRPGAQSRECRSRTSKGLREIVKRKMKPCSRHAKKVACPSHGSAGCGWTTPRLERGERQPKRPKVAHSCA